MAATKAAGRSLADCRQKLLAGVKFASPRAGQNELKQMMQSVTENLAEQHLVRMFKRQDLGDLLQEARVGP